MMVCQQDDLLTIALKRLLRRGREFGLVLDGKAWAGLMVLLLFELDLAADLDGADSIGGLAARLLVAEGGPAEIQAQTSPGGVGEEGGEGLLITRDGLREGIVAGLNLQDARRLNSGAVGNGGAGRVEVVVVLGAEGSRR